MALNSLYLWLICSTWNNKLVYVVAICIRYWARLQVINTVNYKLLNSKVQSITQSCVIVLIFNSIKCTCKSNSVYALGSLAIYDWCCNVPKFDEEYVTWQACTIPHFMNDVNSFKLIPAINVLTGDCEINLKIETVNNLYFLQKCN